MRQVSALVGLSRRNWRQDTVFIVAATLVGAAFGVILVLAATLLLTGCNKAPVDASAAQPANQATAPPPFSQREAAPADAAAPGTDKQSSSPVPDKPSGYQDSRQEARKIVEPVSIPAGTTITVRLNSALSSASSHAGDRFDAVLAGDLTVYGRTLARAGAPVTGRVVASASSGRLEHPGTITLALNSLSIAGKRVPVTTSTVSARGASHKKRNLAMIAGGAGGGALLGGLLGGGKGALIGSMAGAGAGTGTAYATGKKDAAFGVEQSLTFRLAQPVRIGG